MRTGLSCAALIAGALALSFAATPAAAEMRTQMGSGSLSCGAWLAGSSNVPQLWLLGYLSRATYDHPGDMLAPVDADGLKAWVDNYCRAHPLDNLSTAANVLEHELAARVAPAPKLPKAPKQ